MAKTVMMVAATTLAKGSDGFCLANMSAFEAPLPFGLLDVSFPESTMEGADWQGKRSSEGRARTWRSSESYMPEATRQYESEARFPACMPWKCCCDSKLTWINCRDYYDSPSCETPVSPVAPLGATGRQTWRIGERLGSDIILDNGALFHLASYSDLACEEKRTVREVRASDLINS